MAKVVLAPWGHPGGWFLVKYRVEGKAVEGGTEKEVIESFASTWAVARQVGASKVVTFVADTLAELSGAAGYEEVVEDARRIAGRHLCGLAAEVRVLPAVFRTGAKSFQGTVSDYYYAFLREALDMLWEFAGRGKLEVYLDLTHGINYMPSLALKAVEEAISIASLRPAVPREGVRLEVYNSDPVQPPKASDKAEDCRQQSPCHRSKEDPCKPAGQCDPPEAAVNRVLTRRISTADLLSNLEELLAAKRHVVVEQAGLPQCQGHHVESHVELFEEALEEAKRLLTMLRAGLIPLALHHVATRGAGLAQQFRQALDRAEALWREAARVEGNVVRKCRRYGDGYRLLLYAYYVTRALLEYADRTPVTLEAARELAAAFSASPVIEKIQNREIEKIKRQKDRIHSDWRPYREILEAEGGEQPVESCDLEDIARNLIAHGGWHADLIELRKEGDEIYYRVKDQIPCIQRQAVELHKALGHLQRG